MTFSDGERILVPALGRQGTVLATWGDKVVVRLDGGAREKPATRPFPPDKLARIEHRAAPADTPAGPAKPPKPRPLKLTSGEDEEDVQAMTVRFLRGLGYRVWQTTVRYQSQKCPDCGAWHRPTGGYGASKGVPDLLLAHDGWPPEAQGLFIGIEMKNTKTALSPEQREQWAAGRIVIARSHLEAAAALRFIEAGLFGRSLMPATKGTS